MEFVIDLFVWSEGQIEFQKTYAAFPWLSHRRDEFIVQIIGQTNCTAVRGQISSNFVPSNLMINLSASNEVKNNENLTDLSTRLWLQCVIYSANTNFARIAKSASGQETSVDKGSHARKTRLHLLKHGASGYHVRSSAYLHLSFTNLKIKFIRYQREIHWKVPFLWTSLSTHHGGKLLEMWWAQQFCLEV